MNSKIQMLVISVSLLLTAGAARADNNVYLLKADGLACPFCAYGIEKKLGQIKGVKSATTNIASGTVRVVLEEGVTLEHQAAKKAVSAAGFTLRGFQKARHKP